MKTRFKINSAAAIVLSTLMLAGTQAGAKDTVKVAFIGPLSGGVAAGGLGGRNSSDLAVKLRNEDPKAKYKYELVSLDDECKPNVGTQVATKAAADKHIIGAVTHYCSSVALGAVDIYHKFNLPIVVWGAVHPDITYGNDHKEVHRINGTMINQNAHAAEFMLDRGFKTWVSIHDTTDYGKGHNEYFSKFLTEGGGELLNTIGVTADQQDFTVELTRVKSLNPDVIYFGGLANIGVRIRSQMAKLGIKAQLQGTSGIISDSFVESLGAKSEGTIAFREGAPVDALPGGRAFIESYAAANYNEPHEAYGPFSFAAMNLIIDAIEEVGPDRNKVRDMLNGTSSKNTIVGKVSFDDHGQNTVALISSYVVQDGEWIVWENSEYATGVRKLSSGN